MSENKLYYLLHNRLYVSYTLPGCQVRNVLNCFVRMSFYQHISDFKILM